MAVADAQLVSRPGDNPLGGDPAVTLPQPRTLMADGELYDDVIAADIRILPGRLKLWIPTGARL